MVRKSDSSDSDTKPITVRLAQRDYLLLKEYAANQKTSLNSVVSEAVAQYGGRIEREQAISRIKALQQKLRSTGKLGTDSVELLREIREGRARQGEPPQGGKESTI
jgi:uncharacterized protein (DUF1778 family)